MTAFSAARAFALLRISSQR